MSGHLTFYSPNTQSYRQFDSHSQRTFPARQAGIFWRRRFISYSAGFKVTLKTCQSSARPRSDVTRIL